MEKETVWLSQEQIAKLFKTERSVVTKHLGNIFRSNELDEKRNVQFLHIPFSDKPVKSYNLDVIISVGYRVNSSCATQFRIWATNVLKRHLIDGYTLNEKRLKEQTQKLQALQRAMKLIGDMKDGLVAKRPIPCHSESTFATLSAGSGRRISTVNRFFTSFRMTKNGISQQSQDRKHVS